MQTATKRRRLSPQERQELCRASLSRAVSNQSVLNYETIKVISWVPINGKETDEPADKSKRTAMRPVSATVFHISQTDVAVEGGAR